MGRSLAARKMTQVLKAAGGVAESQEPPRSLTSTILSRSMKTGAACHRGGRPRNPTMSELKRQLLEAYVLLLCKWTRPRPGEEQDLSQVTWGVCR